MHPYEVGAFQMRPTEAGAFQMRPTEVGAFQMRPAEAGVNRPDLSGGSNVWETGAYGKDQKPEAVSG
jgi:hypothetical protein